MRKKLLALLLTIAMLFSVLPVQVFAADGDAKYTVHHYTEDLDGEYSWYKTETFYGVPGAEVTATALSIPGFTYYPGHEEGWATDTITANGRIHLEMYYSRNTYTLSYKDGDKSVLTADSYKFEEAVNPQSYSKDGYTFEGWFANAELTENAIPETMPANDVTLYAKCTPNNYTVSYISDGSEVHTETVACDAAIPAYTPEKTGYHFLGWYADEALETAAPETMPASDISLYAKWAKNVYSVTVHHMCNGEKIHTDTTQSVAYLETVTDPVIELDGYYFTDGNITPAVDTQITSDTEMTVSYNSYLADLLAIDSATFSDDAVLASARALYAKLNDQQKTEYTGTEHQAALFDAIKTYSEAKLKAAVSAAVDPTNNKLEDTSNTYITAPVATLKEKNQNVEVALLLPDYLALNMLYIDFLTELFGYEEIRSIQINGLPDHILTGITVAQNPADSDQFNIMFNIAWSTLYPDDDEGTAKNNLLAQKNTLTNSVLDGKSVSATVSAVTAEGVNYSETYTISFFNQSHNVTWVFDNGNADSVVEVGYSEAIEAPTQPTKTGYDFAGWQGYTEAMTMGKTDVTFTAQWTAKSYTVSFNADYENAPAIGPISVTYDGSYALPTPSREGYTFAGWYLGEDKIGNNDTVKITKDETLKAHWNVGQGYSITYVLDGGALEAGKSNTEQYNVETERFTLNNPVKEGYTFLGWTGSNGAEPQLNVTIEKGSTGDKTFIAKWDINQYTITFETVGAGEIPAIKQNYGTAITAPANPTKTGYTFTGWDKEIPATMPAENMTITAQWKINSYTITFNSVGAGEIPAITQNYGTDITKPADPSKMGYTFDGWDKEIPATMPAEDMTITAKWQINQHTITFNTAGGSEIPAIKQDYGTAITAPADPTKTGYTFDGWDTLIPTKMPDQDMTITAKWKAITYVVTFDSNGGSAVENKVVAYNAPYGELAVPTYEGYTFIGWYTEKTGGTVVGASTIVELTDNVTLYAHWNEKGDTPYRIEYYKQNLKDDEYTIVDEDTVSLTGKTGAVVEATQKDYSHFTCNTEKSQLSGTVAGNGSTVLKVYYDRDLYTVTWKLADREITECYRYQAIPSCKESTDRADDDRASYTFTGWDKEPAAVDADTTYCAEYQADYEAVTVSNGTTWRTLAIALANAKSGDVIRLETDAVLTENATVPTGVTLLIPCIDNDPGYTQHSGYLMNQNGTDASGNTGMGPNASLYRSLTIAENVTLSVNGSVLVNAVTGRPAAGWYDQDITGGYAQINLNGSISVENGGHLDAFGFVKGNGSVTVKNGGTAADLYVVRHWRGGSQAETMYKAKIYPMNEYDCHNIETPIRVDFGGSLEGLVKMYATGSYYYTRFPQVSTQNGLIRLKDVSSYLLRTYADGREVYTIYGGADFASSTLKIVGVPLSTGDYIFPIDGDISFVLNSGDYRFLNDYKMMPGALMSLNSGANLTVTDGRTVVFYKEFNDVPNTGSTQYPSDRAPAVLKIAAGASFTNAGTFAGSIYTESANILIGENPCWEKATYEANGYCPGKPKSEHTVEINHALAIDRPGYTWTFGDDLSIVWDDGKADYSAVEAAKAMIPEDLSVYTDESLKALNDALAAVQEGLMKEEQAKVNGWAEQIRNAVAALVRKDGKKSADYTEVMAAIASIPSDLSIYTEKTRKALEDAVNAVVYGLTEDEQAQVDTWAKAIKAAINALVEDNKPCDGGDTCPSKQFTDAPDLTHWAHEGIDYCVKTNLFNGMSKTTFEPDTAMSRAMLVTVLWRYRGAKKEGTNEFVDVAASAWYADAVSWAASNDIVNGVGNDCFDPDGKVTREQVATILYRYAEYMEKDVSARKELDSFSDYAKVSSWATDAMSWAVASGIIGGAKEKTGVYIMPQYNATRAQIATIIMRFIEDYLK